MTWVSRARNPAGLPSRGAFPCLSVESARAAERRDAEPTDGARELPSRARAREERSGAGRRARVKLARLRGERAHGDRSFDRSFKGRHAGGTPSREMHRSIDRSIDASRRLLKPSAELATSRARSGAERNGVSNDDRPPVPPPAGDADAQEATRPGGTRAAAPHDNTPPGRTSESDEFSRCVPREQRSAAPASKQRRRDMAHFYTGCPLEPRRQPPLGRQARGKQQREQPAVGTVASQSGATAGSIDRGRRRPHAPHTRACP